MLEPVDGLCGTAQSYPFHGVSLIACLSSISMVEDTPTFVLLSSAIPHPSPKWISVVSSNTSWGIKDKAIVKYQKD
ncbi:hypothetical protein OPV22_015784 [Ensete ventricosum]|uniref:Uncharacterized protein n=1 Tax=Ensete ventricosum TaxID=4639 RepID=A0AAV8PMS7_ENSVE|nr:hypothetical protein OPV22_015784 [Ensete ventricosum]